MSSGFVSEKEIAEARSKRQEEWEKVRTAEQPLEVPEENYDPRSLFERLDEQRRKRDLEFEESRKLKNMVKGLDDDEVDFLDLVDQKKMEAERNKSRDEEREILDYRNRVASLQEQSLEQRLHAEIQNVVKKTTTPIPQRNNRLSQNQLLKGGLVIKKVDHTTKKRKLTDENQVSPIKLKSGNEENNDSRNPSDNTNPTIRKEVGKGESQDHNEVLLTNKNSNLETNSNIEPLLKCIGILPGLGHYSDNSSSDSDSGSTDIEDVLFEKSRIDLLGRKIPEKCEQS